MKPRVLFADDDEGWRGLMAAWLSAKGCVTEIHESGAQVLARAEAMKPDCVILDYDMPEMKGAETCARLRALPSMAGVPIVILTGHGGNLLPALKEGAPDHFVVKSESPDELYLVLGDLLKDKGWPAD